MSKFQDFPFDQLYDTIKDRARPMGGFFPAYHLEIPEQELGEAESFLLVDRVDLPTDEPADKEGLINATNCSVIVDLGRRRQRAWGRIWENESTGFECHIELDELVRLIDFNFQQSLNLGIPSAADDLRPAREMIANIAVPQAALLSLPHEMLGAKFERRAELVLAMLGMASREDLRRKAEVADGPFVKIRREDHGVTLVLSGVTLPNEHKGHFPSVVYLLATTGESDVYGLVTSFDKLEPHFCFIFSAQEAARIVGYTLQSTAPLKYGYYHAHRAAFEKAQQALLELAAWGDDKGPLREV